MEPLLLQASGEWQNPGTTVPIARICAIAFLAVEVGVYPPGHRSGLILYQPMRFFPVLFRIKP